MLNINIQMGPHPMFGHFRSLFLLIALETHWSHLLSFYKKNKYILITGVCESCCCQAVDYSDRHRDNTALHSGAHNHATYLNHFFVKDVRVITSEAQCVVHKLALITSGGVIKYILNKCNQQQFGSNPYLT